MSSETASVISVSDVYDVDNNNNTTTNTPQRTKFSQEIFDQLYAEVEKCRENIVSCRESVQKLSEEIAYIRSQVQQIDCELTERTDESRADEAYDKLHRKHLELKEKFETIEPNFDNYMEKIKNIKEGQDDLISRINEVILAVRNDLV